MTTEYFVRLKPRASKKRKGVPQTPERYMIHGLRFEAVRGWYRIDSRELANELRLLTHNDKEDGILIFDVVTKAEAERLQANERRTKIREVADADIVSTPMSRTARRVGALTTADTKFEAEPAPMIDGEDEGDADAEDESAFGAEPIGALPVDDEPEDLNDGDEPEPTKKPVASPPARARRAAPPAAKKKR